MTEETQVPGVPSRWKRWAIWILGITILLQGLGKLLDLPGYVLALDAFQFFPSPLHWPVGILWAITEVVAGAGLLAVGLAGSPNRKISRIIAWIAVATVIGYATLTTQAYFRGLTVNNCTCFGVYLSQKLSLFVLAQDAYVLLWASFVVKATGKLSPEPWQWSLSTMATASNS